MVDDQIGGVTLEAVARADLDDLPIGDADEREEVEKDAVFAVLLKTPELDVTKIRQLGFLPDEVLVLQSQQYLHDLALASGRLRH